jgi:hypothetical protein
MFNNLNILFKLTNLRTCKCSTGVKPGFGTDSILHWSTGIVLSLKSDGGSSSISDCLSIINLSCWCDKLIWFVVIGIVFLFWVFVDWFAFLLKIFIILFRIRLGLNFCCLFFILNSLSLSSNSEFNSSSSIYSSSSLNDLSKSPVRCCRFVDKPNLGRVVAVVVLSVGIVLDNDTIVTYPTGRFCISSRFSSWFDERIFDLTFSFVFKYKCKSKFCDRWITFKKNI